MFKDLLRELGEIHPEDEYKSINISVPDDFYQTLLSQLLERDYLNDTSEMKFVNLYAKIPDVPSMPRHRIHWMQILRLPVHPNENENYDLLSRWQGVLSSLHAWGYRLYFLLLRFEGKTKLFLGTSSSDPNITADSAIQQLKEAAFGSMPGMELKVLSDKTETLDTIIAPLQEMNSIGAVTGIPSFQDKEKKDLLQTLDKLAFGIRDSNGVEKNYAMLVISDPISDSEITDIISRYRRLGSQIHTAVKLTLNEGTSTSKSYDPMAKQKAETELKGVGIGVGVSMLGAVIGGIAGSSMGAPGQGAAIGSKAAGLIAGALSAGGPHMGAMIGGHVASSLTADISYTISNQKNAGLGKEYLDKFAEYAESVTEHHIKRLNEGRNFGFWNTGVYVLGNLAIDVKTVTGMIRSIYSGEETYYEPIRLHLFDVNSNALQIVRDNFDLLPMIDAKIVTPGEGFNYVKNQWHLFGKNYQYLSTPVSTKELSLATSLPRRDVPGLRFVKTAVRFANNPSEIKYPGDKIRLGRIVDTGIVQGTSYDIDINSLVRHTLVSGITGSGKSTTCKRLLKTILNCNIPVMVIEPAKDDYVRWAINMNKNLPPEKQFRIFMPGFDSFDGFPLEQLKLNLFEPAHVDGAPVDLLQHSEIAATLLNACLPSEEVIPILIEETVYDTISLWALANDRPFEEGLVRPMKHYPRITELLGNVDEVMRHKTYEPKVRDNMKEILTTRFKSLSRGTRGKILNVDCSTDYSALFSGNVIINISRLAGSKDKALVMSLMMQALYEYRISRYTYDKKYREKAQQNKLMHVALIEEAHNVLLKPNDNQSSGSPQRAAADLFGNMLSELRGYGQGFIVVDQVPTRLIDDVIKNTNYKIVHRITAPDDQAVMASSMAFREDQKSIIPTLEKGNAIICGDEDDAAAWIKIPMSGSAEEAELDEEPE